MSLERARVAWLAALQAHVRAATSHEAAAAWHTRMGHPERAARESAIATAERHSYDVALARHPEWADDALPWPEQPPV
jgi:hypothetical protein